MIGLTEHELGLAAHGGDQARLITGGHFTPQWAKEARARQILLGEGIAA